MPQIIFRSALCHCEFLGQLNVTFGCHGECFAPTVADAHAKAEVLEVSETELATSSGVVRDTLADNSVNFWSKTVTS